MVKPQSNDHAGQPSQADIARALGISPARVTALKARGMPTCSVEAAAAWRTLHLREHVHRRPASGRAQPPASVPAAAAAQAPARLAPELAAASDQATVYRLLEDGLHQALAHLREEAERNP